ncbi:iron complex outermembrane receptor protein [Alteromonadaceae bacterium 2753L.S.0a.02]|nr:iron complex outermembrane receptor protein [Alteromonadaceae bacterium 2753L.S.0a.02]
MRKPNKLAFAIRAAALGFTGAVLLPNQAFSQEESKKGVEEVFVTGSHIKRTNFVEGSQVVVLDEMKIDAQSALVMSDILRTSPLNSYGSFSEQSGSSAQSNATVDLRGLGEERTLVTIDGRRMVGSPNFGAAIINVNMIPHSAIKSIDILADGASAVYGSDAVAGVVNMQLQKGFEGFQFKATYGDRDRDDGSEYSFSLLGGMSGDRGNITFALEKSKRDPIFDADRYYTAARADDLNGNGVIDIYTEETEGYSYYGKTIELYDPNTDYVDLQAATTCEPGNNFYGVASAEEAFGIPGATVCMYGYANASANKAGLDKTSAYMNATYEINDNINFFVNSLISRVESFGRYAPPAAGWPDMPADYEDVPYDIDALIDSGTITEDYELNGYYRWTNIGTRDNEVTDTQYDFVAGFEGDITDGVSYEVYLQDSSYYSKEYGYYYLSYPGLDYVLAEGIDPFSEEGAGAMSSTPTQDNFSKMSKASGHIQFDSGDWFGAGQIITLLGGEYFDMDYQNKYDRNSEVGLVGGSAGNSSSGDREVSALFGEIYIPILSSLEVNGALRYDSYSDFGTALSPSISATWATTDSLTLRTKFGRGFRAPGLDQLYGPDTFDAQEAKDVVTCAANGTSESCPTIQVDTYSSTNENLDAETSDSISFGLNWQVINNFSIDVSYWDIKVNDLVDLPTAQEAFYAEAAGVDLVEGGPVYVDRDGARPTVYVTYTNEGELHVTGLDTQLNAFIDTGIGTFSTDLLVVNTLSYKQSPYYKGKTQETNGFNLQPKVKAQWGFGWQMGPNLVTLTIDYIGPHSEGDDVKERPDHSWYLKTSNKNLDSWTTFNASYAFDAGSIGRFKIGARNLTDEDPVFDSTNKFPTDHYDLYDQTGRVLFAEYSIKF